MSGNILFTDYYEFTVSRINQDMKKNPIVTQSYFYRRHKSSHYVLAVGQHKFIEFVQELNEGTLMEAHIEWLERASKGAMSEEFLDYLANFKFDGEIDGVSVGTPMFPNEPVINVTGSLIDTQILETYLLHSMNTMSPVATEAARLCHIAGERSVAEFGARRSFNPMMTAEAAYIGGAGATSFVKAGFKFNIPLFGTMSHAFVQSRWDGKMPFYKSELIAFREYAKVYPDNCILLVDTYNTTSGTINAVVIARELRDDGHELVGIRLDSGDMAELSKECRKILNYAGFPAVKIFLSDGINANKAKLLLEDGAEVDGFGCGTNLVHPPPLGGVYKLVQCGDIYYMKFTDNPEKMTLPGKRQVYRKYSKEGLADHDLQALWGEEIGSDYTPLLHKLWGKDGPVSLFTSLTVAGMREYTKQKMKQLSPSTLRILDPSVKNPTEYRVELSPELTEVRNGLIQKYRAEFEVKEEE